MEYDVHFSIAAFVIFILLLFCLKVQYNNGQTTVKKMRDLIICLLLADFFDVVSAYTIAYHESVPVWLNYLVTAAFFVFEAVCMYMLPRYVRYVLDPVSGKKIPFDYFNDILVWVFGIISATSCFNHLIFYFEGTKYIKGSLYNLTYGCGVYFLTYSFIRLMLNRDKFSHRQFYSIVGYIVISIGGSVTQFVMPGSLFVLYFFFSMATFVIIFGLETPDYIKLEKTLAELEQSQADLEEAVVRAEAADRAKSDFLANMSHEIRTPINAVLGMNELISRESNQPVVQNYSANLADAGQALLSLINDILDFSKIEAGRMELSETDYELSVLIREVNNIVSTRCEDKGLKFVIKNNPDIPNKLHGDDVRIRQILVNILNNAVKYTDAGSVMLDIDYAELDDSNIELIVAVRDTGIGIKEEDLPALFESFKRIDLEKNRKREGTGLGLNITRSLVQMMDGSIDVSSVYGEGSVFTVRIKQKVTSKEIIGAYSEAASSPKGEKYQATFKAPNARILVVDDVKMNLVVMKGLLKQTEVGIDLAMSGKECLEKIEDNVYDIIFLDHMMPEMDGVETMKRIKENTTHCNQNTPVVMLTANAIIGVREQYLMSGFTDYLSKPVPWKELEEMLIKYLPSEKVDRI